MSSSTPEAIPSESHPHKDLKDIFVNLGPDPNDIYDCPICQEEVGEDELTLRHKNCRKCFHVSCLEDWVQHQSNTDATCPTCRAVLRDGRAAVSQPQSELEDDLLVQALQTYQEFEVDPVVQAARNYREELLSARLPNLITTIERTLRAEMDRELTMALATSDPEHVERAQLEYALFSSLYDATDAIENFLEECFGVTTQQPPSEEQAVDSDSDLHSESDDENSEVDRP